MLNGKTWIVWRNTTVAGAITIVTMAATITIDIEEPLAAPGVPVWPDDKRDDGPLRQARRRQEKP